MSDEDAVLQSNHVAYLTLKTIDRESGLISYIKNVAILKEKLIKITNNFHNVTALSCLEPDAQILHRNG